MDNSKVNRALADTEKRAESTSRAGDDIGSGFERGAKKSTGALGKITKALAATRKDAARGVNVSVDVDSGAGEAKLAAFERARASADGKDIDVQVDVDTGGAIAGLVAFRAAAAGVTAGMSSMGSGVSAGGVRIAMIGGIAATAAAMFTPLLGALASVGSLGAAAGAGIGLIAAPLMMVVGRLKEYHEGLDKAGTAQKTAQTSAKAYADAQDGVRTAIAAVGDAERQRQDSLRQLDLATDALTDAQTDLNWAMEDEPTNLAQNELNLANARDRVGDATRAYNQAVREHGANSEEATDAARDLQQAELDLSQQTRDTQRIRENGSDQLNSALDAEESAQQGVEDAQRAVADSSRQLLEAQRGVAKAQQAAADAAAQAAADQNALQAATASLPPALMALYSAAMRFKTTASTAFGAAQNAVARLGVTILRDVTPALDVLGRASTATIGALSRSWAGFMAQVRQPVQQQSFAAILGITPQVVNSLASGVGSLGLAITNMLAAAAPYAVRLAQGFERAMNALLGWSRSGAAVNTVVAAVKSAGPVFSALWTTVKQASGALFEFGVTNSQHVATAIRWVGQAVTWLINGFSRLTQIFGPIVPITAALTPLFLGLALVFGQVLGLFTPLIAGFSAFVGIAGGPLTVAIAAAILAGVLLYKNWDKVRAVFAQVRAALAPFFASIRSGFQQIKAQVMPVLTAIGNGIRKGLVTALRFLIPQVKQFVASFRAGFAQFRAAVLPVISAVARGLRTALGAAFRFALNQAKVVVNWFRQNWPLIQRASAVVFNFLKKHITTTIRQVWNIIRAVVTQIIKFFQANWGTVQKIVRAAWNIIKTTVSTAIKAVLGIIKAIMQAITGDWRGAWNTIKKTVATVLKAMKSNIDNVLTIIKNVIKLAWNAIKSLTNAAWEAVRKTVADKINAARNRAKEVVEQLKVGLKASWEAIRKAAGDAWTAISGAIWRPIETAYNKVTDFIDKILSAVNRVLDLVGLPTIGSSGDTGNTTSGGNGGPGRGSRPVRARRFARGGYVDGDETYVVGDKRQREYIINPSRRDNAGLIRSAAADYNRQHRTGRTSRPRVPARSRRGLFPPWRAGGAAALGGETHSYVPEMQKFVSDAEAEFPSIYTNSYTNHPPGFEQPYYRERSVDFWGSGGRGSSIGTSTGDATTQWTIDRLGSNLNWLIWNGRMLTSQGWGPDTSGFDHSGHQHTTAFADGPTATGGGSGGDWKARIFEAAWNRFVQPIVDTFLGPLKDSPNLFANVAGAAGQKIPDGIKQWAMDKFGSMGGLSGGSGLSGTPAQNRALGEKMFPNSGLPGQFSDVDAIWTQESGWDHTAQNPTSSAFGIPQFLDSTWEQYGGVSKDAEGQIKKGYMYIGDRYGSTGEALSFKQANGWYDRGGLIKREHDARVHPGELYLPLDNPGVMQTAQTALGTAELRAEIADLKQALVGKLDDVNLANRTVERQIHVAKEVTRGHLRSIEGAGDVREIVRVAEKRGRQAVRR